jgi:hypothetical protein
MGGKINVNGIKAGHDGNIINSFRDSGYYQAEQNHRQTFPVFLHLSELKKTIPMAAITQTIRYV